MVGDACNLSTLEKAGKSEVQNLVWLYSEFQAGFSYMRSHIINGYVARVCGSVNLCV